MVADRALDLLDPPERAEVLPVLFPARSDWTCLLATNQPDVLARVDRIIRIEKGRVVAAGPAREMLANDPWCRALTVTS